MNRRKRQTLLAVTAVALAGIIGACSCAALQKCLDRSGISDVSEDILNNFNPGTPEELRRFLDGVSLDKNTKPLPGVNPVVSARTRWKINHPRGYPIIHERISFTSRIQYGGRNDRAHFYLYRRGDLKVRRVILWVPGMGVSDFAFRFIKKFFRQELLRDYDILFYVPPFHMERTVPGQENGAEFFTSDIKKNITVILESVRELRTGMAWLRDRGVSSIGGWGGSIGAAMLLLAARYEKLDHCCVMIPIINWNSVTVNNPLMNDVIKMYRERGFNRELIESAWDVVNPQSYELPVSPGRMHVMYARYDQLTPAPIIVRWARMQGISNVVGYDRSHATILLNRKLYQDCGRFLDSVNKSRKIKLRHRGK